jgi:hypothetical protein
MTSAISRGASIDSDLDRRGSSPSPLPIRNKRVQSPLLCGRLKSDISEMFEGTDEMKVAFSSPTELLKNRIESVKLNSESENVKTPLSIRKAAAPASARGMPVPLSTKPIIDRVSSQHEPPSPICSVLTGTPLKSNTPLSHNISLPTVTSPSISTSPSLKVATTPSIGSAKRMAAAPVSVRSTNKPPSLKIAPYQRESIDASGIDSNAANYHGDSTESTPRYSWPGGKGSPHSRTGSVSPHDRAGSPTLEILGSSSKKKMLVMNNKNVLRVTESSLDLSEESMQQISSSVSSISDFYGSNLRPVESVMKPELITSEKKNAFVSSLWNFSNDFLLSGSVTSDSELSEKNEGSLSEKSEITLSPRRASNLGSIQEPSNIDRSITDTAVVMKKTASKDVSLKVALDTDPLYDSLRGNLSSDMMNTARSEDPPRRRRRSTRKLNRSISLPGFKR